MIASDYAANLAAKMKHPGFLSDTQPLLRPGIRFDPAEAHEWLAAELIPLMP